VNARFCRGFYEKRCAERGFLMVVCGEMRGKRGEKTALFVRRKLRHLFDIYF
jgi:hypothetical protein